MSPPVVPHHLPRGTDWTAPSSSYFKHLPKNALPSPSEVREQSSKQAKLVGRHSAQRPLPARFEDRGLVVKWGKHITEAEGQVLWILNNLFNENEVPAPEVLRWCKDPGQPNGVFIYMRLVEGDTLAERWEDLSHSERESVYSQLGKALKHLRTLKRTRSDHSIEHVGGQPLQERMFQYERRAGPFQSLTAFHDWFAQLSAPEHMRMPPAEYREQDDMRAELPDGDHIVLTQNDLDPSNIIVSRKGEGPIKLRAIVDWHQSAWLPAYWEYCKAMSTNDEWATKYLAAVLDKSEVLDAFEYFVQCLP